MIIMFGKKQQQRNIEQSEGTAGLRNVNGQARKSYVGKHETGLGFYLDDGLFIFVAMNNQAAYFEWKKNVFICIYLKSGFHDHRLEELK